MSCNRAASVWRLAVKYSICKRSSRPRPASQEPVTLGPEAHKSAQGFSASSIGMPRKKARQSDGGATASAYVKSEDEGDDDAQPEPTDRPTLPHHLQVQHDYMVAGEHLNYNTSTVTSALAYLGLGIDNQWDLDEFKRAFRAEVAWISKDTATSEEDMEFDLQGIDPAIANAFRRILLAEVPTMAIEHVFIINNTSIIPDEMLAHRLGLIPIKADAALFQENAAADVGTENNCIIFKLKADCKKRVPSGTIVNDSVFSRQLVWLPKGSEIPDETKCKFSGTQHSLMPEGCAPVHDDILIAKLRPGQGFEVECVATKGNGAEHAKWSPVATAWYRLLPEVALLDDITGADAEELAEKLPGLFTLDKSGAAVVGSARDFPQLHEKVRALANEERWRDRMQLRKRKDHFIFTVQSTGILPPDELFIRSVDELSAKCGRLLERL
ncbi:hypothetical protein WJX73_009740 [Symbiochloris irregularis]|uniref:DNA-directed RNA polymerases I and III subunit RPAC1 n=1 Tax=Symbiochloris irregularis TaxID=706552 RepID=A0AAW1PS33_9CHLO